MMGLKSSNVEKMKKSIVMIAFLSVLVSFVLADITYSYGNNKKTGTVNAFLAKDITVKLYGIEKSFLNSKKEIVYPIIYKGTSYLPIRTVAEISGENLQWVKETKTMFLGKTLQNPNKSLVKNDIPKGLVVNRDLTKQKRLNREKIDVYVSSNVIFMKDFVFTEFKDSKGHTVPMIFYQGSAYAPVIFLADMLKETVEWENKSRTISIGSDNYIASRGLNEHMKSCQGELQKIIEVYDTANTLIGQMSKDISQEEKIEILNKISESLIFLSEKSIEIEKWDLKKYEEEEKECHRKVYDALIDSKNYIEILENIAYLKAEKKDISILEDMLKGLYIKSQQSIDEARNCILNFEREDILQNKEDLEIEKSL